VRARLGAAPCILAQFAEAGITTRISGAASRTDCNVRYLLRGLRYMRLLDAPRSKPRPDRRSAAFAPLTGGWYSPCTSSYYGERGWRGGGNKDRLHKRSVFVTDYQGIVSLSSYVRLTIRISGAAYDTGGNIRNSLRGLRCMRLLCGILHHPVASVAT
jgi:hypothetical protein